MAENPSGYFVVYLSGSYGEIYPLQSDTRYTIGRSPGNRIPLRDDMCSREHAELSWFQDAWHLRDLQSLNGAYINDVKLIHEQKLAPGDVVRFGHSRFIFVEDLADLPTNEPTDPNAVIEDLAIRTRLGNTKYHATKAITATELPTRARHVSQTEALSLLYRLALDTAAATTPAELAELVLAAIFAGTTAEVAAVLAVANNREAEPLAYRTRNPDQRATYHKVSRFVSGEVIATRQAILAEDVAAEKHLKNRDSLSDLNAASLICAPVTSDDELLGLVHLYSVSSSRRLNADDLELTLAMARQFGIAWQRLRRETGLSAEVKSLKDRLQVRSEFVGASTGIKAIENQVSRVAPMKTTVLIRGESGVGKELVARALHNSSPRKEAAFICLNCAALTETLLESELFGHEKGAFTGATDRMIGKFESADGGTIFLDEIGEMAIGTQAKLLRVLEGQSFERVGGNTPIRVDVRVVAATNRPLEEAVRDGTFRKDLFFRLQVVQIDVPPLRARVDDIPLLARHFLQHYQKETGRKFKGFTPEAIEKMMAHKWPGNVRELRNTIERAVVLSNGPLIDGNDIWLSAVENGLMERETLFLPRTLEECEKQHIDQTLRHVDWNKSRAAELLDIERSTLDRKIKAYGLQK